jgi:hypothetical protein
MKTIKKQYIQPSIHVVEAEIQHLMSGSQPGVDPGEEGNGQNAGSRLFSDDDDDEWFD